MIEDATQVVPLENKFLVVLDSRIPSAETSQPFSKKSNMIFDLSMPIIKQVDDLQLKCSIKNAVFPNSFYTINDLNSDFSITLIDGINIDTLSNISLTIPQGNYSAYELTKTLNTVINDGYADIGYISVLFTVTFSTLTNKLKFVMSDSLNIYDNFRISFQPSNIGTRTSVSQLGDVLGFSGNFDYYSGPFVSIFDNNAFFSNTNGTYIAPYPVNLSGITAFNVILNNYNTSSIPIKKHDSFIGFKNTLKDSNYNSSLTTTNIKNNIICNIPVNVNPFEYIYYTKQSEFFIDIKENIFSRINILICDNLGNFLDFNNQDWTITLEFCLVKNVQIRTKSFYEILQSGRF